MTDININGRKLSKFNPVVTLDNENIYSQKDLDEEREATIDRVLEIIERLNHNGSVSIKLLRKEIEVLKGGEQE